MMAAGTSNAFISARGVQGLQDVGLQTWKSFEFERPAEGVAGLVGLAFEETEQHT